MGTFLSERELSELTAPDNTAFPSPVTVANGIERRVQPAAAIRAAAQS